MNSCSFQRLNLHDEDEGRECQQKNKRAQATLLLINKQNNIWSLFQSTSPLIIVSALLYNVPSFLQTLE